MSDDLIKLGIYFPPCPRTRNRKIIKAWEAEKAQFDIYSDDCVVTSANILDLL